MRYSLPQIIIIWVFLINLMVNSSSNNQNLHLFEQSTHLHHPNNNYLGGFQLFSSPLNIFPGTKSCLQIVASLPRQFKSTRSIAKRQQHQSLFFLPSCSLLTPAAFLRPVFDTSFFFWVLLSSDTGYSRLVFLIEAKHRFTVRR